MTDQGEVDHSENGDQGHKDKNATAKEAADTAKTGTGGDGGDHIDTDGGDPDQKPHR